MSNWPIAAASTRESAGIDLVNSRATQLPNISAAHTWTAWTQLIASTASAAAGITLQVHTAAGNARTAMLQLAIGAGGDEFVIAGPISIEGTSNLATEGASLFLPIALPAGTRVSARWRATATGTGLFPPRVSVHLHAASPLFPVGAAHAATVLGATINGTTTQGTVLDAGATIHTLGASVELTASTSEAARGFVVNFAAPEAGGWRTSHIAAVQLGPAGSEVIVARVGVTADVGGQIAPRVVGPFLMPIPAGTRIAMSVQSPTNTAGQRTIAAWLTLIT